MVDNALYKNKRCIKILQKFYLIEKQKQEI